MCVTFIHSWGADEGGQKVKGVPQVSILFPWFLLNAVATMHQDDLNALLFIQIHSLGNLKYKEYIYIYGMCNVSYGDLWDTLYCNGNNVLIKRTKKSTTNSKLVIFFLVC